MIEPTDIHIMTDCLNPFTMIKALRSHIIGTLGLLALLALPLFPASNARAQEVRRLTFDEVVLIALDQNVSIKRAENNLISQQASVKAAKGAFLPNLNASSGASQNYGSFQNPVTFQRETTSQKSINLSANSTLNLFNGFADVAGLAAARQTLESMEYSRDRTRQTVVFNVITNYLDVILAEENIRIREEDVIAQEQVLNRIVEFVRAGSRAISDQYTQETTLANSEAQLLNAETTFQLAKTRLTQILQLDPLIDYEFLAPNPDDIPLGVRAYDSAELVRSAFAQRPDLKSQEASIEAARQGIRVARAAYLPRLNLSGSVSSRASCSSGADDCMYFDQLDDNQSKSISLSLNIPIFNRFGTKASVQRSKIQYLNAQLDQDNLQQSIALEVRQAYFDYQTAVKRLDVTQKQLRSSQQALDVEQERYDVGASTLVELTQARSNFVNASSQRAQSIFQFHFQQKLIEYFQGILDPAEPLFK